MTKEQREELKKRIEIYTTEDGEIGYFIVGHEFDNPNSPEDLYSFIESEVEKAKKEGRELGRKEITEEGERLQNQIDKLLREARENVCRERRIGLVN